MTSDEMRDCVRALQDALIEEGIATEVVNAPSPGFPQWKLRKASGLVNVLTLATVCERHGWELSFRESTGFTFQPPSLTSRAAERRPDALFGAGGDR